MKECECKHNDTCNDNMAYPGNCNYYEKLEATNDPPAVRHGSKPYLKRLYLETLIEKYKKAESIAKNNVYRSIYAMFVKELKGFRDL